jgi:hypothetical protein
MTTTWGAPSRATARPGPTRVPAAEVRAWARRRGLRVAAGGRLPVAVVRLYLAERPRWGSRADLPARWWLPNDNAAVKTRGFPSGPRG